MKLKQILFGGLLVAVPFAACTNEDLIDTNVASTPDEALAKAVSLGADFSIVGEKGADTRAYFTSDLRGSVWERTDTVGGAWYAYTVDEGETGAYVDATNKKLFSNHPFAFNKDLGGMTSVEFKANTNAFAGKYLLYYPYDSSVATVANNIPVKVDNNPTMDCTAGKELDHVNANMFAWCDAEFTTGGSQAGTFALKQAGNLLVLKLGSTGSYIDRIQGKGIERIIVESSSILYNEAKIQADATIASYEDMAGKYVPVGTNRTYVLTVKNAGEDYKITEEGEAGLTNKAFYLYMLPAEEAITSLTVKVIMEGGRMFKADLAKVNYSDAFSKLVAKGGKKIELNVLLTTELGTAEIYTADQFVEALANAGNGATVNLATDITVPSLDFNKRAKTVTVTGASLTVEGALTVTDGTLNISSNLSAGSISVGEFGKLVANNNVKSGDVTVAYEASITGGEIASASVTRGSELSLVNVTVKNGVQGVKSSTIKLNNATLKGTSTFNESIIKVETAAAKNQGTFTATGATINVGTQGLTNEATMTLSSVEVDGTKGIVNAAGATLNLNGGDSEISKIENAAAVTLPTAKAAGKVVVALGNKANTVTTELDNAGKITVSKGTLKESEANKFAMKATSVIDLTTANSVLDVNASTTGSNILVGSKIIVMSAGNIVLNGGSLGANKSVATEVTAQNQLDTKIAITGITEVILNADGLEVDATTANILAGKVLTLKNNVKFTGAASTMTMNNALNVDGDVTLTSENATSAITLVKTATAVNKIKGKLTIGKNVSLAGDGTGRSTVNVKEGNLVQGTGGTITMTKIDLSID